MSAPLHRRLAERPIALIGAACLASVVLLALLGPLLHPVDPWAMDGLPLLWPGEVADFPLGTDSLGRDLAAGLVSGATASLLIGLSSAVIALAAGMTIGTIGGYYGGWADKVAMRTTEVFQTVPSFVLSVVIVALFRPTLTSIVFSIGITSWPSTARLVRAQVMALREREFVLAARLLGMSDLRLIVTQIMPNALPPVLAVATLTVAHGILTASGLAFIGLGDPNVMDWGAIIGEGREQLLDAWYICAIPGIAIGVTVLGFSLLGEALNDALNPRLEGR